MTEPPFEMNVTHRQMVEKTITDHCNLRNWSLHASNARSNHVHVVVTSPGYAPKIVRQQFQAWCTRKLKSVVNERVNFWTERGSERYINTEDELDRVVQYVLEAQDLKYKEIE
jgi:REP element-mobilizing transposase RayT